MNRNGTIWDEHVFGNTFNGKTANLSDVSFCVDADTPLVILGERESPLGGDIGEAKKFFEEHGFSVRDTHIVKDETEEHLERYLLSLSYWHESVVILTKDRLWSRCVPVFQRHGIHSQLFSRVQAFFFVFRPNLWKVYKLLEDDRSKEVFTAACGVRYKLFSDETIWPYCELNQYFPLLQMHRPDESEVFVDCGAFVGDTVEKWIDVHLGLFKKIYAFEPSEKQRNAFMKRAKRLTEEWALDEGKIVCVPFGVGEKTMGANLEFSETGHHGLVGMRLVETTEDNPDVQIVDLDTYLRAEKNIGFIKADVEGFEMEMLRGAQHIIQRDKPKLAISLYHKLTDYYEIPLWIKEVVPEYKMFVRHHSMNFTETVLYAYI